MKTWTTTIIIYETAQVYSVFHSTCIQSAAPLSTLTHYKTYSQALAHAAAVCEVPELEMHYGFKPSL